MNVLVGCVGGASHLRKVTSRCLDVLGWLGHDGQLQDLANGCPSSNLGRADAVIVVAEVNEPEQSDGYRRFVRDNLGVLRERPLAMVAMSLSAAVNDTCSRLAAMAQTDALAQDTGLWPIMTVHIGGNLDYRNLNFLQQRLMRRLAANTGLPTDVTRNHDLTDWEDLTNFVEDFAARADGGDRHVSESFPKRIESSYTGTGGFGCL